jgi:O-antigen/teichoic acid export membrane protein
MLSRLRMRARIFDRPGAVGLATGTAIMAGGSAGRLLLQILLFVVVARMLGTADYGGFVSVTALVAIISTFAGLACEVVLVKNVSRNPQAFAEYFGNGLILLAVTTPVLVVVSNVAVLLLSGARVPWAIVTMMAVADLFFLRVNMLCAAGYQAFDRMKKCALLNTGFSACRLAGALLAAMSIRHLGIVSWAFFYSGSAVVAALLSFTIVTYDLGRPRWFIARQEFRFGFHTSLQATMFFAMRDIDKPLLSRLASLQVAGLYAAAFRLADAAVVPIRALMYAASARYFRHGRKGARGSSDFALRLLPYGVVYGALAFAGIEIVPWLLPWVLGHQYAGSAAVLRVFGVLPLLHATYNIGADALSASGHQSTRSSVQGIAAGLMAVLCVVLIPRYGIYGAAIANITSHATMAAMTWFALLAHRRRSSLALAAQPTAMEK